MTATSTRSRSRTHTSYESARGILLDIGCGANKQPGCVGMDRQALPGVDVVHSWNDFPWPFEDESVLTAVASHVVEHVNPADGHWLRWMDEVWRILKPGGQLALVTPYAGSPGYWMDPTHCNGCSEATWFYFDPCHESMFWLFYRPRPWKIQQNFYHREGNLEVVLRKRPVLELCTDTDCPRPAGHDGEHWILYHRESGLAGPPVSAVIASLDGHVKAEWGVPVPLTRDAGAYRLAETNMAPVDVAVVASDAAHEIVAAENGSNGR